MIFGSTNHNKPSRFIEEIPPDLIENTSKQSIISTQKIRQYEYKSSSEKSFDVSKSFGTGKKDEIIDISFNVGDTVIHKTFGKGVILSAKKVGNDCLLEIAFEQSSTKKLMAKFAKLEKV